MHKYDYIKAFYPSVGFLDNVQAFVQDFSQVLSPLNEESVLGRLPLRLRFSFL